MSIVVVDYDPGWPAQAAQTITVLREAVPGLFLEIEHIGSTSIIAMPAKPIIDLMVAVASLDDLATHDDALRRTGFGPQHTSMPDRLLYIRNDGDRHTHNLHVVPADTWETRNERLFRDYVRTDPDLAQRYGDLKRKLAGTSGSGDEYVRAKTALVQEGVDAARDRLGLRRIEVWED